MNIIYAFGNLLGHLMSLIYNLTGNYGLSIILFTFLTKIILFPLNMLMQKNSINMARLMPEENALKIKYIDDKDKLADERLALYKRYNYHPVLGSIPLLIQIPLVLGLVYVIYHPLTFVFQFEPDTIAQLKDWFQRIVNSGVVENSYQLEIVNLIRTGNVPDLSALSYAVDSIRSLEMSFLGIDLSLIPSFHGNYILLLVPLFSGLSAWLMCHVQNRINILQFTQGTLNKTLTTLFMIAFSTYFAFLVPAGVGLYWIFGNLFSIPVMFLLNTVMPPEKYVDYDYLKKMKEQRVAKEKSHRQYLAREKACYKEFFSVENMQLMFYSEQSGFYKYFSGMIDYICEHSDIQIHYVTSDPDDVIFSIKREQIHPYYIASDKYLIPLFMKLECDMCIMTTPDLEKYHIKRSRVRKDIEYVFACHGMGSTALTFRKGSLDWFDTVFCPGIDQFNEIRATEELYNTPKKCLVETGYPLIDEMIDAYDHSSHTANTVPKLLIAPSWQPDNIIDLCVDEILDKLAGKNYEVILRPHPQQVRHEPEKFDALQDKYKKFENIEIQTDFSSNSPVMESDILITDWSDISWEFAFVTKKPVLFIDTPMKVMNPEYDRIKITPINISLRNVIGRSVAPDAINSIDSVIDEMLAEGEKYKDIITSVCEEHIYNLGKSKVLCGRYIIKSIQNKL